MACHDFVFFCKLFDDGEHIEVECFSGVVLENRNGIPAGEYQCIVVVGVAFQVGYNIVGLESNAGIAPDGGGVCYCKYLAGNTIFEESFQILE